MMAAGFPPSIALAIRILHNRLVLRRTFLFGTAALVAARSQDRPGTASLGSLAYVDQVTLWLRDLPDGAPRVLATGHRLSTPRFSPSGQWISFHDGDQVRVVTTSVNSANQWTGGSSESGNWIPDRDELAADERTIDENRNWQTWTSRTSDKTTLLLSSFPSSGEPKQLDETEGFFEIAGFTRSGKWLLYWRAREMSSSIRADGLGLYAASTGTGQTIDTGIGSLLYSDFVSFSPTEDMVAVTSGGGRETWASKGISMIDLTAGKPVVVKLTEPSVSAQMPAWSPDGKRLAWCAGPDADALYKQQLLASGQKTIKMIGTNGVPRDVPITPGLSMGAPYDVAEKCVRLRRIWVGEAVPRGHSMQLTNDSSHFDEAPVWSSDGSHILFCRTDAQVARTIWLMRSDGSETRQVAGPLNPPPDLTPLEKPIMQYGYYGHTDWSKLFDWWRG